MTDCDNKRARKARITNLGKRRNSTGFCKIFKEPKGD